MVHPLKHRGRWKKVYTAADEIGMVVIIHRIDQEPAMFLPLMDHRITINLPGRSR